MKTPFFAVILVLFLTLIIYPVFASDPWEGYITASISGNSPLNITFTDISYNSPTAWNWSFRDVTGNNTEIWFSQIQNPTYTFTTGNYAIRLNASNVYGYNITPTLAFVNVTNGPPVANFSANQTAVHPGSIVQFTDLSTNTPTAWEWQIETNGVGGVDAYSSKNLTYTIPNILYEGPLFVQLNASNPSGYNVLKRTGYLTVSYEIPVSNFTANTTTGNAPLSVGFTQTGTGYPKYYQWYWYANETLSSTLPNPTTIFTTGTYNVRLYTYNSAGGTWMNKTGYITATSLVPVANFHATPTTYLTGQDVQLYDDSTNIPTTWYWEVDRPSPGGVYYAYTKNPLIPAFTATGNYSVRLYASNSAGGNWSNKTGYLIITSSIIAPVVSGSCTPRSGDLPIVVTCTDSSLNNPTSWWWRFGGYGGVFTASTRNYTFTIPYTVTGRVDTYDMEQTVANDAGTDTNHVYHGYASYYNRPAPTPTPTPTPPTPTPTPVPTVTYVPGSSGGGWSPHMRDMAVTTMATIPAQRLDNITEALFGGWNETNQSPNWEPIITNSVAVYTDFLGPVAFLLIFLIPFGMMWLAHGNMKLLSILGIIVGLFVNAYLPANYVYAAVICIVVAGTTLVWSLFRP